MPTVNVYDNGGITFDRYTVIIDDDVYLMSLNPMSPQGLNQYAGTREEIKGDLGKQLFHVPKEIQRAIDTKIREK